MDNRLEVIVIPVGDVDRAKQFYLSLGWRLDADVTGDENFRIVQVTAPGSPCSIIFGNGVAEVGAGPVTGLHLAVSDIDLTRKDLQSVGVDVSDTFHDVGGVFHHAGEQGRVEGPDPERRSYASFATFTDPDGNRWWLQELTTRLPGRVDDVPTYGSVDSFAAALRRAAAAHGEHENRLGQQDLDWPAWYATYLFAEHTGAELPS